MNTIKGIIRSSFKDVGKGWFSLAGQSQDTYFGSKLHRFLVMVRFLMEDNLKCMVDESLAKYVEHMDRNCSPLVDVRGVDDVAVTWHSDDAWVREHGFFVIS